MIMKIITIKFVIAIIFSIIHLFIYLFSLCIYIIYIYIYVYVYIYIYIYIYNSQIEHNNSCFNLFLRHNNLLDNQGSEINKNDIFYELTYCLLQKKKKRRKCTIERHCLL